MTTTNAAFRVTRRALGAPTVGPFLALLLAMAFFSYKSDVFLEGQNLSLVLQQVMVVGVLAIGQTFVILTAGIDLSCGTVMAFGQIVMTKLAVAEGVDPLLAIALGIAACVCFGLLNGVFVARACCCTARISPTAASSVAAMLRCMTSGSLPSTKCGL